MVCYQNAILHSDTDHISCDVTSASLRTSVFYGSYHQPIEARWKKWYNCNIYAYRLEKLIDLYGTWHLQLVSQHKTWPINAPSCVHVSTCKLESRRCACTKRVKMLLVYMQRTFYKGTQSDVLVLKIPSQHALHPLLYFNLTCDPSRIECHLFPGFLCRHHLNSAAVL